MVLTKHAMDVQTLCGLHVMLGLEIVREAETIEAAENIQAEVHRVGRWEYHARGMAEERQDWHTELIAGPFGVLGVRFVESRGP